MDHQKMKLFILKIIEWEYDCVESCAVIAENEKQARELIFKECEQKRLSFIKMNMIHQHTFKYNQKWLNENESKCHEIDMTECGVVHVHIVNG